MTVIQRVKGKAEEAKGKATMKVGRARRSPTTTVKGCGRDREGQGRQHSR